MVAWVDPDAGEYTPSAIKSALPIEWLAGRLWDLWIEDDGMVACPLHEDSTPSFNLWAPDSSGVPQKWGCFGCGARGDVIDAIMLADGVSYQEALTLARDTYIPEFQQGGRMARPRSVVEPTGVDEVWANLPKPEDLTVAKYCYGRGIKDAWLYAKDSWRWRGVGNDIVAMPHFCLDGAVTGIKMRNIDSKKWSVSGSRYSHLYGSWRNFRHDRAVICEGETDTVWAAWQLHGLATDVFGLASGVSQVPPKAALDMLAGRKIALLFDGDGPGAAAAERWAWSLKFTCDDIRTITVPSGEDVVSCGIPVADLLEVA